MLDENIAVQIFTMSRMSETPAVSKQECIASCASPMSAISTGTSVLAIEPSVEPPGISERLA